MIVAAGIRAGKAGGGCDGGRRKVRNEPNGACGLRLARGRGQAQRLKRTCTRAGQCAVRGGGQHLQPAAFIVHHPAVGIHGKGAIAAQRQRIGRARARSHQEETLAFHRKVKCVAAGLVAALSELLLHAHHRHTRAIRAVRGLAGGTADDVAEFHAGFLESRCADIRDVVRQNRKFGLGCVEAGERDEEGHAGLAFQDIRRTEPAASIAPVSSVRVRLLSSAMPTDATVPATPSAASTRRPIH